MARRYAVLSGLAGLICLVVVLNSCTSLGFRTNGPTPTPTTFQPTPTPTLLVPTVRATLPPPASYQEAPALQQAVMKGDLPPVRRRLPSEPKVVPLNGSQGVYGGTWRMVIQSAADEEQFIRSVGYEPLLRWTPDWLSFEPNLLESYTVNRNATEYTFQLRKGIRWSDGVEFTTEDIRFWYEDVLLNPELTPIQPYWLKSGGTVAEFTYSADDKYAFRVHFSSPNSLFLAQLATPDSLIITSFPAHYAKNFHVKYAPADEIDRLVKEGNYRSWADMFIGKVGVNPRDTGNFVDPARPRLSAWVLKTPYTSGAQSVTWERNPYYWKVDPQGNQLPYIDQVVYQVVNTVDEEVNLAVAGQIDMQDLSSIPAKVWSSLTGWSNQVRFFSLADGTNNVMVINFNLATQDEKLREVFQNMNFRIGLSYAINRQDIISQVYGGKAQAWQPAPRRESVFFDQNLAGQYLTYDLYWANFYLDKAGYKKDVMGNRLRPDGEPISFTVLVPDNDSEQITMLNMIAQYWRDVGIEIHPKAEPQLLFLADVRSNLHEAAVSRGGSTFFYDVLVNPSNYVPISDETLWGVRWANWYNTRTNQRDSRDRPIRGVNDAVNVYDRIRTTTNIEAQRVLAGNVLTLNTGNFWTIGIALGPDRYGVVSKSFHNVPARMPSAWTFADPGPANPEQFYIQP
jgi:peptide/nickel transport system substrate-binding protein